MTNLKRISLQEYQVTTLIIGAGHNGLAMSSALRELCIDHVILERGKVGNAWRADRWDSLKLLTNKGQCQLPFGPNEHHDSEEYYSAAEFADYLVRYRKAIDAPVLEGVTVLQVTPIATGYRVLTNRGIWRCRTLVLATGANAQAAVPKLASSLPLSINQVHSLGYKNPAQLAPGPVLVVGASATGLQIAQEIQRSGRQVCLSVGEHVRLPRHYRGYDIFWWLKRAGISDESVVRSADLQRLQALPSPQLIGNDRHRIFDLNYLQRQGIELVGRLAGCNHSHLQFSGSLENTCALADLKMRRLLKRFDEIAPQLEQRGHSFDAPETYPDTHLGKTELYKPLEQFQTVVWATGYKPDYSWLRVPVFDKKGQLCHTGGEVHAPGLYALGLPAMRRRQSSFIHGTTDDVRDIAASLFAFLTHAKSQQA